MACSYLPTLLWVYGLLQLSLCEVVELTNDNFDTLTESGKWFLEFYAPWCGHCKKFAPIYNETSEELKGIINFGAIDATKEKTIANRFNVKRFPTIKFFEENMDYSYSGRRSKEGLISYAEQMMQPILQSFDISTFEAAYSRHSTVFLAVINPTDTDMNENNEAIVSNIKNAARLFRPDSQFFISNDLQSVAQLSTAVKASPMTVNLQLLGKETLQKMSDTTLAHKSFLAAITPALKPQYFTDLTDIKRMQYFVASREYPPLVQLMPESHRKIMNDARFIGIAIVDYTKPITAKFLNEFETVTVSDPMRTAFLMTESDYISGATEDSGKPKFNYISCVANYTRFQEWAVNQFKLETSDLPVLIVYDTDSEGYYQSKAVSSAFIDDAMMGKLEITYTRNWFIRKAMGLENFMNSLAGWQIAIVFLCMFGGVCLLVMALDYFCDHSGRPKRE